MRNQLTPRRFPGQVRANMFQVERKIFRPEETECPWMGHGIVDRCGEEAFGREGLGDGTGELGVRKRGIERRVPRARAALKRHQ